VQQAQSIKIIRALVLNPKFGYIYEVRQIFLIWLYNEKDKTN
jgi:hypothetical protein